MSVSVFDFQKDGTIGVSEMKSQMSLASSTAVYENVPKNREMILVSILASLLFLIVADLEMFWGTE